MKEQNGSSRDALTASVLAALVLATTTVLAQAPTLPGRGDDFFNLGPTGAAGTPLDAKETEDLGIGKAAAVRIETIEEGAPAAGVLMPGDVVVRAGGRPFPPREDPILHFSRALEAAEAAKTPALKLHVLRSGTPVSLTLPVQPLGAHSPSCPVKCKKCAAVLHAGLRYLAKTQEGDGGFIGRVGGTNAKVAATTLCGLAFLASGSTAAAGPYASNVKKALAFVARNGGQEMKWGAGAGRGNMSQVNWNCGYAVWLLAEGYAVTGDRALLEKIGELANAIVKNQEASGGWAHGPGGPNALGYLELEIVSNVCLTALGLAQRLELEIPKEPVDRGVKYVEACSGGDGGVGYSTRPGQQGMGDPGRTAGAIVAFRALGLDGHPFFAKMNGYYRRGMKDLIGGHVSPCMHLVSGALAAQLAGPKVWAQYWGIFRDEVMAARCTDGSFSARPTRESQALRHNTDRGEGPHWITGHFCLLLQAPASRLKLLGK